MAKGGDLILGVSLDDKEFDEKLTKLVYKAQNKKVDIGITEKSLEQAEDELWSLNYDAEHLEETYFRINEKLQEQKKIIESLKDYDATGKYSVSDENQPRYEIANREANQLLNQLNEIGDQQDKISAQIDKQQEKVDKLNGKYEKQKNDLDMIEAQMNNIGDVPMDKNVDGANKSSKSLLKSITKWGLAIFGIRSAYMGIRQVMNSVLSQNKSLGDQMDAMKKSLYAAFTPIVEKIINLIRKLMAYINYVWKRLFGKNLFTDKVAKDLKSGEKSAKEISKQLAGFDEANVLSDNKSSGSGAGGGTTDIGLGKVKIPKWLEKIMDWVEKNPTLSKILFGLAPFVLFGMVQLGKTLTTTLISKLLGKAGTGATGAGASGLLGILGTMLLIAATVVICKITYDKVKEAWEMYKALREEQKLAAEHAKEVAQANIELDETFRKNYESGKITTQGLNDYIAHIRTTVQDNKNLNESETLSAEAKKENKKETEKLIATYQWLYENGKLTADQEYDYYQFLRNEMAEGLDITNEKLGITKESFDKLDTKYKTQYEVEVKTKGKEALDNLASLLNNPTIKKWLGVKFVDNLKSKFNADGGIIVNMPGRGVPINYAGEAGREGIIPMDNESQMQLLGQSIAKYVRIDNYINNYMDARKVNTILQQSANQERLANNG